MSAERLERINEEGLAFVSWTSGRPRALALLHGFTGSPESWSHVARSLSAADDVYALELPGHGGDYREGDSLSLFALFRDLAAALPRLHPGPWRVCGYSMGGRLALGTVTQYPDLCDEMVLIGVNPGVRTETERRQRREWEAGWVRILKQEGLESFLAAWESLPLFESQSALGSEARAMQSEIRAGHSAYGLAAAMVGFGLAVMPDLWPALPTVRARVKLVVGERDLKFRGIAEGMCEILQAGTIHVVSGVGHNVLLEAPESIADVLLNRGYGEQS